ncbi:hypothetical protein [Sphaerisporangium corydalis]|uniref:Uncharacterized protein n=1 Tax=Sphaerisporangium corydalis TaxID=1441875 RepID=A0ABV9EEI9_9ACTN|nr:hypothetical protein [Sphaerisporangium corydalis]
MTAHRDFKRLVRARARATGLSYTAARRLLLSERSALMARVPFRRVQKAEYGFAVNIPESWAEREPDPSNSQYEVARFVAHDKAHRTCLVFRRPAEGVTAASAAERARDRLEALGFGRFEVSEGNLGDQAAVRLDFDRASGHGLWSVREYFVATGGLMYCLGLGSSDAEADAETLDALATGFEILAG